jgi:hypothetical protein
MKKTRELDEADKRELFKRGVISRDGTDIERVQGLGAAP